MLYEVVISCNPKQLGLDKLVFVISADCEINAKTEALNRARILTMGTKAYVNLTIASTKKDGKWCSPQEPPKQLSDKLSVPVLVQYKDDTADLEVLTYSFVSKKFLYDQLDFTDNVFKWRYLPDKYKEE